MELVDIGALLPEVVALPIFCAAIYIMYRGVEIDHPVFRILFNNLIFQLLSNVVILTGLLTVDNRKIALMFPQFGNIFDRLFHHTSWMMLSCLRYCYVAKSDWLHSKWPDPKRLRGLSQSAVSAVFFIIIFSIFAIYFGAMIPSGWPKVSYYELPPSRKMAILIPIIILYISPILVSLVVYVSLLCHTENKISHLNETGSRRDVQAEVEESNPGYGGIYMGDFLHPNAPLDTIQTSDQAFGVNGCDSNTRSQSVSSHSKTPEATRAIEERGSTLRALKTNLFIFVAGTIVVTVSNSISSE